MIYVLAIFIPPLAPLLAGRPGHALLNILLCLLFWFPGIIHAKIIIADTKAKRRHAELMSAVQSGRVSG